MLFMRASDRDSTLHLPHDARDLKSARVPPMADLVLGAMGIATVEGAMRQEVGHCSEVERAYWVPRGRLNFMSKEEVDAYLKSLDEPKRSTLEAVRRTILEVVPDAEQCISYGAPAFRLHGKVVAGFAAFKNHLSYLPHSGSVFPELMNEISQYKTSSGALQFPVDTPLPKSIVTRLIAIRKRQALGQ